MLKAQESHNPEQTWGNSVVVDQTASATTTLHIRNNIVSHESNKHSEDAT